MLCLLQHGVLLALFMAALQETGSSDGQLPAHQWSMGQPLTQLRGAGDIQTSLSPKASLQHNGGDVLLMALLFSFEGHKGQGSRQGAAGCQMSGDQKCQRR